MREDIIIEELLNYFQNTSQKSPVVKNSGLAKREQLKAYFTVLDPYPAIDKEIMELADELFRLERQKVLVIEADLLPNIASDFKQTLYPSAEKCMLWQGDITSLRADAIVNAANAQLLGCFLPFHACIDNAIHSAAGPRLREACYDLMTGQGYAEKTGEAKITGGYFLPSSYVLHTVGPIVQNGMPTILQEQQLSGCYINCLELAASKKNISSVAFCCISTGVFGYPADRAAKTALTAVSSWLKENPMSSVQKVIFNVFSDADYKIYKNEILVWK